MKNLIIIAMITAFLVPLALGGCSTTQSSDSSSSYEKKKSGYGNKRYEGSGGY
jgi:uncharacterized protein YceK